MEILPAIDLKDQKVVRLTRGDYAQVTVYSEDPLGVAEQWLQAGAEWLHLVDLDAALEGKPVNFSVIEKIGNLLKKKGKHFEIGGGIREKEALKNYIEKAGASRVILGTVAYKNPEFVKEACKLYPGKIAVGIDLKDGKVATHGWTEVQELTAADLAVRFQDAGVSCIVYTDIARDGMLSGLNMKGIADFVASVPLPVVVAGGLRDLKDIENLLALNSSQIEGAITGKAIYEGTLDLKKAIERTRSAAC
ncbi:MAG: 1-(5-phosphoribosyl)-5-[(5-phosphoribosylamino)methylideneamino]imidazole-4-carboxamide isomerase [bacterium]